MSCELIANGVRVGCGDDNVCTEDKQIGVPKKRTVREDVPYRNGSYDFSALDGQTYYEDRELEYKFGIIGSEQEVLAKISELTTWLYGIQDDDIWDTDIPYWHFHGSCDEVKVKYDETGMSADLKAKFTVGPFLIADSFSEFILEEGENYVINKSRRARIFLAPDGVDGRVSLTVNGQAQDAVKGLWTDLCLESGQNIVDVRGCKSCLIMWKEVRL